MHLKATIIKWLKLFGGDTRRAIVGYIVVGLVVAGGGVIVLTKTALTWVLQISNIQTPLWATFFLILVCGLYTYLRTRQRQNLSESPIIQEELHEEFGVYWNNQFKLRCLRCKWPLKSASKSFDPSIFFCSNCDTKYALRDKNGNHLSEAQAIEQLKKLPTSQ